jgi:hypothetical protein
MNNPSLTVIYGEGGTVVPVTATTSIVVFADAFDGITALATTSATLTTSSLSIKATTSTKS